MILIFQDLSPLEEKKATKWRGRRLRELLNPRTYATPARNGGESLPPLPPAQSPDEGTGSSQVNYCHTPKQTI